MSAGPALLYRRRLHHTLVFSWGQAQRISLAAPYCHPIPLILHIYSPTRLPRACFIQPLEPAPEVVAIPLLPRLTPHHTPIWLLTLRSGMVMGEIPIILPSKWAAPGTWPLLFNC